MVTIIYCRRDRKDKTEWVCHSNSCLDKNAELATKAN